ncbi:MAG: hypothetical protein IPM95_01140 [Sphingobacteriales bacterium]|nr:hypothetical protein [Sphingobacteriales bacterium]
MHGVLKPWKLDTSNNKRFTELVKEAKKVNPSTCREQHLQLYYLLADYPTLQKVLETEIPLEKTLQPLCFNTNLPMYNNAVTNFYYLVITLETQRIYNRVLEYLKIFDNQIDLIYHTGNVLKYAKVLAKQASIELDMMGFSGTTSQVETSNYAIYCLKHSLIQLYFSIQEQYKDRLEEKTTLEDFYLLDLEEPLSGMLPLEKIHVIENDKSNQQIQEKLSFGFNEDVGKLRTVINLLCIKIELLNSDTKTDDLITILTAKNIIPGSVKIQIGCETVQFRYIIDKLKPSFNALNPQNIELSKCFFTKKGTLIKAQNLYTNKISNPKEKDKIDNIIKQLQ